MPSTSFWTAFSPFVGEVCSVLVEKGLGGGQPPPYALCLALCLALWLTYTDLPYDSPMIPMTHHCRARGVGIRVPDRHGQDDGADRHQQEGDGQLAQGACVRADGRAAGRTGWRWVVGCG